MNALLWPWHGLVQFLTHPRWWVSALLGSAGGIVAIVVVGILSLWWYWPTSEGDVTLSFGDYVHLASQVIAALAGLLAIILPFTKIKAGRAVLRPVLASQGIIIAKDAVKRPISQQIRYLLMTAAWRVFWIIAVISAVLYNETLGLIVGLWALGHLMCSDACDQALMLRGRPFSERRWELTKRSPYLLAAGGLAGLMAGVMGITVFGWLLWAPAIFIGAAFYVATWDAPPQPATSTHLADQAPSGIDGNEVSK